MFALALGLTPLSATPFQGSPALIAATEPMSPNAAQLSCEVSTTAYEATAYSPNVEGITLNILSENSFAESGALTLGIVHPVATSLQALVTSEQEHRTLNTAPTQNHCNAKEDPTDSPEEEETTEDFPTDIPNLDPSVLEEPAPSAPTPNAPTPNTPTPNAPTIEVFPELPAEQQPTTETSEPATASPQPSIPTIIPASAAPTSPVDSSVDPRNVTPDAEPAAPFDGSTPDPTLAALADGSYRYLAGNYQYGVYTDAQLMANGGAIFLLTKAGDQITGTLRPRVDQPGVCISGVVRGNSVLYMRQSQTESGETIYSPDSLDLSEYSRINAGSAIAPTECDEPTVEAESTVEIEQTK